MTSVSSLADANAVSSRADGLDAAVTRDASLVAADRARRFGGVARLYGAAALRRFESAHVAVIGIGGVGSWAVEALARSAIGHLTLIDLDHVAESNTNRQLHALDGNFGKAKAMAMQERIAAIDPACRVDVIEDFVEPDNLDALLGGGFDFIIDAIDGARAKTALIAWCHRRGQRLVTVGAAGGQTDPTRIRVDDLARTVQDPLLSKVRADLRRRHGFARGPKARFGIVAVYSDEPLRYPPQAAAGDLDVGESLLDVDTSLETPPGVSAAPAGLNCAGFGSSVCVTAGFGLAAAAQVLNALAATAIS